MCAGLWYLCKLRAVHIYVTEPGSVYEASAVLLFDHRWRVRFVVISKSRKGSVCKYVMASAVLISFFGFHVCSAWRWSAGDMQDRGRSTEARRMPPRKTQANTCAELADKRTYALSHTHTHTHTPRSPIISKLIGLLRASFCQAEAVSGMDRALIACLRCTEFESRNVKSQG